MTLLSQKKAKAAAEKAEMPERPKWSAQNNWNNQNRHALQAHSKVKTALKSGKLKRGKCWCGSLRVEGHHENYAEPLKVTWLCRKHHRALHAQLRRDAKQAETHISAAFTTAVEA